MQEGGLFSMALLESGAKPVPDFRDYFGRVCRSSGSTASPDPFLSAGTFSVSGGGVPDVGEKQEEGTDGMERLWKLSALVYSGSNSVFSRNCGGMCSGT